MALAVRIAKWIVTLASVVDGVIGAIYLSLGIDDPDAHVNQRFTGIYGTVLTGLGIVLSALVSIMD
jgi:hypothetical protein